MSHPAWDEWIEICLLASCFTFASGLIPLGMSGLKFVNGSGSTTLTARLIPLGMSGLKYRMGQAHDVDIGLIPLGMSGLK